MTPPNYDMAIECLRTAEHTPAERAPIEAMAAQTYATLALVDEMRLQRGQSGGVYELTTYHAATTAKQAMSQRVFSADETFDSETGARTFRDITGHLDREIYQVSVKVVQS